MQFLKASTVRLTNFPHFVGNGTIESNRLVSLAIKGECVAVIIFFMFVKLKMSGNMDSCHIIESDNSGSSIRSGLFSKKTQSENNKISFFSPDDRSPNLIDCLILVRVS